MFNKAFVSQSMFGEANKKKKKHTCLFQHVLRGDIFGLDPSLEPIFRYEPLTCMEEYFMGSRVVYEGI